MSKIEVTDLYELDFSPTETAEEHEDPIESPIAVFERLQRLFIPSPMFLCRSPWMVSQRARSGT